jgi:bifunctional isochorismate lyase/aryl carrier protein
MKPIKEAYFSLASIEHKSLDMKRSLDGLNRKQPILYSPRDSALLVLDMQSYFLNEASHAFIPSVTAILPRVNGLIAAFTGKDLPIFFTRHLNTSEDAGLMATWWREIISHDNPLSEIDPRIEIRNGISFEKTRYDAFFNSPLEELLKKKKVRQVVISGVMTHLCCETTARSAFMRGFDVFFTIDGTATYNEAFHRASLLNLAHGFATPILVQDILTSLEINGRG